MALQMPYHKLLAPTERGWWPPWTLRPEPSAAQQLPVSVLPSLVITAAGPHRTGHEVIELAKKSP